MRTKKEKYVIFEEARYKYRKKKIKFIFQEGKIQFKKQKLFH